MSYLCVQMAFASLPCRWCWSCASAAREAPAACSEGGGRRVESGTESNHGGGARWAGGQGARPPSLASRSTPCASDRPPCTPPTCTPCSRTHLTRRLNRCPLPGAERDSLVSSKCRTPSSRPLTVPFGPCSSSLPHSLPLAPSILRLGCAENCAHPRSPPRGLLLAGGCNLPWLAAVITPSISRRNRDYKIR